MFLPKKRLWGCRENRKVDSWRNPLMSAFFLMGEATAEARLYKLGIIIFARCTG